jgi:hypothetical protein
MLHTTSPRAVNLLASLFEYLTASWANSRLNRFSFGLPIVSDRARDTQSYSICNIQSKFWVFCKGLNVMGVNINLGLFALLTGVVVSLIHGDSPLGKLAFKLTSFCLGRIAVLVSIGSLASSGFAACPIDGSRKGRYLCAHTNRWKRHPGCPG